MSNLTRYEQETIINFNNAEPDAQVFTYSRALIRKLNSLAEKYPNAYRLVRDNGDGGLTYHVPKKYIKVNAPRARKPAIEDSEQAVFESIFEID